MSICKRLSIIIGCFAVLPALGANLVVNGDFESGNVGFFSGYAYGDNTLSNTYTIGTNPATATGHYPDWLSYGDHTTGTGNMFIADGGVGTIWSETVTVTPGSLYTFTFWGATINANTQSRSDLQFSVNGTATGSDDLFPQAGGVWTQYSVNWNSGTNTTAMLSLTDLNTGGGWNDFSLDDISFNSPSSGVPEPTSIATLLVGLGLLAGVRSRKSRSNTEL
jgi:hypothetical protein